MKLVNKPGPRTDRAPAKVSVMDDARSPSRKETVLEKNRYSGAKVRLRRKGSHLYEHTAALPSHTNAGFPAAEAGGHTVLILLAVVSLMHAKRPRRFRRDLF